jgi:hypothetical protein
MMDTPTKPAENHDLPRRVRHFTRVTFASMLWCLLNTYLYVRDLGPEPYYLALLALTLLGTLVVGLNLVRLHRMLRGPTAPMLPDRGYLVPVTWTPPPNDEHDARGGS